MTEKDRLLEAHVQFELARWAPEALTASIAEEVEAMFGWLGGVPLGELLAPDDVIDPVLDAVTDLADALAEGPPNELADLLDEAIGVAHAALLESDATLAEVLPHEHYEQVVAAVVALRDVRPVVIEQITSSKVYAELIAYVLYQGIKSYLMTENVVARRIPGASSLLRLGQNAINSAAPNLEAAVDKQLVAFIHGNISQTIQGSSSFLVELLDDEMIRAVADEVWRSNAETPVAEAAALADVSGLEATALAARSVGQHLAGIALVEDVVVRLVEELFERCGDVPVTGLLARIGVGPDVVTRVLGTAAGPLAERAVESGYLERRIRDRLDAFYSHFFAEA